MNAVEELEEVLTLDQMNGLDDFDATVTVDAPWSTQHLLDELLGVFEEDDSPMFPGHSLPLESYADSDE
jgi:hypothetical protein